MREIRIAVNLNESTDTGVVYNAGLMFEHNTTKLVFELEEALIKADYKYHLDFATPSGIVRTDYLVPDETGAISYLLPAAVTSQMSVICCLNIIRINETTYKTEEVIKPKIIKLSFSTVEGDSKELAESFDFSINAMLEAIKNGDFKGEKGDKGDTGAKGEKGDKGDTGTVIADSQLNSESSNPVENKAVTAALDKKVDKTNGMGLSSNDFTDEYKLKVDSAEKTANKITEFTGTQTDEQYPSAKLVYDNLIAAENYTDYGLAQKVDKISGKTLSTNDFTNSLKQKLNGIESGANKTTTDLVLSNASTNPVANKVITAELDKKLNLSGGTMSGNLDMTNHPITNLAEPTEDNHAANKAYVDNTVRGQASQLSESIMEIENSYKITVGKNLFDVAKAKEKGYISSEGSFVANDDFRLSDKIRITAKSIVSSATKDGIRQYIPMNFIAEYDNSDNLIKNTAAKSRLTLDDNTSYFRFSILTDYVDFMVEYGEEKTAYEPYHKAYILKPSALPSVDRRKWLGLKWTCVGDSLTAINDKTTMHYHDYIAETTGITVQNLAISGSGYAKSQDANEAFYQRILLTDLDTDVVTIFGSFNDSSADLQYGTIDDTGTDTYYGCVNNAINNLYSILPTVQLGIIAPTPWESVNPYTRSTPQNNYVDMLKNVCEKRGIPFLDLYHTSGLRPWDSNYKTLAYSKDNGYGVHPDELGHKIIAPRIEAFLEELLLH